MRGGGATVRTPFVGLGAPSRVALYPFLATLACVTYEWQVLLITGPAGAGKTTVARHIADTLGEPSVHVSLDDMRESVRWGIEFPDGAWNDETQRQYDLARRACSETARIYAEAGFKVVIDDAVFPEWEAATLEGWQRDLGEMDVKLVVLLPTLEWALERNAERLGRRRLADRTVHIVHRLMRPWRFEPVRVIDNTGLSVEATAALILDD